MPDNRQNHVKYTVSDSSNGPLENVQEGIRRIKIETSEADSSAEYPDRPGEPDCIYYLRTGLCGYGTKCRFNHPAHATKAVDASGELPQRTGQPDCGFYVKTGTCKYGGSCKYHHPRNREIPGQAPLNALGLPTRQDARPCPYYMRTYTCKFGARCKFNHPHQYHPSSVLPVSVAHAAFPTSMNPSAAIPAAYDFFGTNPAAYDHNGVSAMLLPPSPYLLGSTLPAPQTYAPLVLTAQGWTTYNVGTTASPTSFYGTNFYNAKDEQGEIDSMSKMSSFPERPDQPECRYFMSTGNCKYGCDCRYHHPKQRPFHPSIKSLGPHGLPLRPGEAICSYLSTYGVCIYGPMCKFDHPIAGYVSSYGLNQQQSSVSIHDQAILPNYQDYSSIRNYSESSPSKSVKISDWIPKPETVEEGNIDANSPEDAKQLADDHPPQQSSTCSEVSNEQ